MITIVAWVLTKNEKKKMILYFSH